MNNKLALVLSLTVMGCGKSKSGPPPVTIDVDGVNALVPAELKDKLVFEKQDVLEERGRKRKTTYTLAGPKGWTQEGKMFAKLRAPSEFGFMTSVDVGSNCDGACEPKDWAKVAEKVNFKQFREDKIVKDEAGKTSHLLIAEKGDSTHVMYAWWGDGGSKYYTCSASLSKEVRDAAPAFAKACQAVAISGDD